MIASVYACFHRDLVGAFNSFRVVCSDVRDRPQMSQTQSKNTQISFAAQRFTDPPRTDYPNADFLADGHPVQQRDTRRGRVLVCRRCGRWATLREADQFDSECDPHGPHPKHYSVRLKLLNQR